MMITLTRMPVPFVIAAFCGLLMAGCGEPASEPEEELRAWVATGVEAAEDKDRRTIMSMISSAYADARGNEPGDLDNLLRIYFLRQNRIVLLPTIDEITVYDETAGKIDLTVGMAGTNDRMLGFSADAYRFVLELEKDGGDWQLISARWGGLGDELR